MFEEAISNCRVKGETGYASEIMMLLPFVAEKIGKRAYSEALKHLEHEFEEIRSASVTTIAQAVPERSGSVLAVLLADTSSMVRKTLITYLPATAPKFERYLVESLDSNDEDVVVEACRRLVLDPLTSACGALSILWGRASQRLKPDVLAALGACCKGTVRELVLSALDDANWEMQQAAISALGNLKARYALAKIRPFLTSGNRELSSAAELAVQKILSTADPT